MRRGLLTSQGFCIALYNHYLGGKTFLPLYRQNHLTTLASHSSNVCDTRFHLVGRVSSSNRVRFLLRPISFYHHLLPRSEDQSAVGNYPWCWLYYRWSLPVSPSVSHARESVYLPRRMHSILRFLFYTETLCSSYPAINAHLHCMPANKYVLVTLLHMGILPPLAFVYLLARFSNDYHTVQDLDTSLGSYSMLLRHFCSGLHHPSGGGESHTAFA